MLQKYTQTVDFIKSNFDTIPSIAIVLGSGLSSFCDSVEIIKKLKYKDIPFFPVTGVASHKGEMILAEFEGKRFIILSGRIHCYEGHSPFETTFFVRILNLLGVKSLILTNAAGAINTDYAIGDIVIIDDHIKLSSLSPLVSSELDYLKTKFVDMTHVYSENFINFAKDVACKNNIDIKNGVYIWCMGPEFETPAQIRAFRVLGADLVGMSTIFEATMARALDMNVLGVSFVANMAAGIDPFLTDDHVVSNISAHSEKITTFLKGVVLYNG